MWRYCSWFVFGVACLGCGPPVQPLPPNQAEPAGPTPHPHGHAAGEHHGHSGHACGAPDHRFDDAERWSKVFDAPERDAWQKPDVVVKELALAPSDRVADLGAGTGYFAARLSQAVPSGKVYAIDIEPNLVSHMKQRAEREGTANVEPILGTASDPKLPPDVNVVLVVDTYHHIADRTAYFERVRQKLSPGARVVIVDFRKGKMPVGPPEQHKLAPEVVVTEMAGAGYAKCRSFDGLPYQYMLTFSAKC